MGLSSGIRVADFLESIASGDEQRTMSRGMEALVLILTALQSVDKARGESQMPPFGEITSEYFLPFSPGPKATRTSGRRTIDQCKVGAGPRAGRL